VEGLVARARTDPAFAEAQRRFATTGIEHWLEEDEKALHFAVGAFAPGDGIVVEIGSYQGGSACFLAAGIARRGSGRLTCVDPHLGGPPWLGMAPGQRTLEKFRWAIRACGLSRWVETRVGDSAAVASIWPALPLDAVFIDADHSFRGVLRDLECWGTKVKPGGLVLFDDADDSTLTELRDALEVVKTLDSISHLGTVGGVAVFEVEPVEPWQLIDELREVEAERGVRRGWDMSLLHGTELPERYGRTRPWTDHGLDIAYQLCFLARCGPGPYGYTPNSPAADRRLVEALSRDRGDGDVVAAGSARGLRALLCRPEEAAEVAGRLQPGGVLISRDHALRDHEGSIRTRRLLLEAGLEGCGWHADVHWGVWRPDFLSSDAILEYAAGPAGREPRRR
jgi:predicted O-methyltransferase YrrM